MLAYLLEAIVGMLVEDQAAPTGATANLSKLTPPDLLDHEPQFSCRSMKLKPFSQLIF